MSELDIYISIASNLEESGWSHIFSSLDKQTFEKIKTALDGLKSAGEKKEEEIPKDLNAGIKMLSDKFSQVSKALRVHRKRLEKVEARLRTLEETPAVVVSPPTSPTSSTAVADIYIKSSAKELDDLIPKSPVSQVKKRQMKAKEPTKTETVDKSRRHHYQFGSRKVQVILPSEGYPAHKEAMDLPKASLELTYSHGYNGNSEDGRQNLYLTPDGKYLLYFIASVCVRHDIEKKTQSYFRLHNDDITTICMDPREGSTLAASGQKDPKDRPGEGKDYPKIWVWNWATMQKVKLIDNVCWGRVGRIQWSKSGHLYCICGDEDHTLKAWNADQFKPNVEIEELIKQPTIKDEILGFKLNPTVGGKFLDEMVIFGQRRFDYGVITQVKDKLQFKSKLVPISDIKKDGEKAFLCAEFLPDGNYAVGSTSGAIYICKGSAVLGCVSGAHEKSVGDLYWDGKFLITGGFDKHIKRWTVAKEKDAKEAAKTKFLVEKWNKKVEIAESDLVFQPKALVYNPKDDTVFCGTKSNQICTVEMKEGSAKVVVDGHDGQVWGLCTHPTLPIFATGGHDNAIKIWDAAERTCFRTFEFPIPSDSKEGRKIAAAAWSRDGRYIAFGSEDSYIFVFRFEPFELVCTEQIPPKSKNAEVEAVSYLRFSEDSEILAAAHMDANLYIFTLEGGIGSRLVLQKWEPLGHIAAPTCVQFSADGNLIKTFTRDYEIAHWILNRETRKGKFSPHIPDPDKTLWGGDPLIAGWDVQGLYQKGWDGTDLNDCSTTQDRKFIASGDDYGIVRLHSYPAIAPEANRQYTGHAEFVVGIEFLRDDSQLITCGGNDMAIFQWTFTRE